MKEDARTKGLRLLMDGRLTILLLTEGGFIHATCKGDSATYDLGYDPWKKEWRCTCQARTKCSHLWALTTVTSPRVENAAPPATAGTLSPEEKLAQATQPAFNALAHAIVSKR